MELVDTTFIQIIDSTVHVKASSIAEAKIALKELKLKKKEFSLLKRNLNETQKNIRASYTDKIRTQGSMMRGGGGFGKFIRALQTVSRDSNRANLANSLSPIEHDKQQVESIIHAIDSAILQVEAYLVKNNNLT